MPYIPQRYRTEAIMDPGNAGELTYAITKAVVKYLGPHAHYQDYAEAIGMLECAKLELYRRMVAPYEDKKCNENGDVYP